MTNIKMDFSSEVLVKKVISMRTQFQNSEKLAIFSAWSKFLGDGKVITLFLN